MNTPVLVVARMALRSLREGWRAGRARHSLDALTDLSRDDIDPQWPGYPPCGQCGSRERRRTGGVAVCSRCAAVVPPAI